MPTWPLGLACVGEAVRRAGHEVMLPDLMHSADAMSSLQGAITGFRPEAIGISVRNIDDQRMNGPTLLPDQVREVTAECRSLSDAPIILGGAGFSIFPLSLLNYLGADLGIRGEGEGALPDLLDLLAKGGDTSEFQGPLV